MLLLFDIQYSKVVLIYEKKWEGALKGQCSCGEVQFEMTEKPLFVHACHCTNCQRQSGSAHALNGMIEAKYINLLSGQPEGAEVATGSGQGQTIYRCPTCKIGLWSVYAAASDKFFFVRIGTLEDPGSYPPDINIFTKSKQPWVPLMPDIPATEGYYDAKELWSQEALARMKAAVS